MKTRNNLTWIKLLNLPRPVFREQRNEESSCLGGRDITLRKKYLSSPFKASYTPAGGKMQKTA